MATYEQLGYEETSSVATITLQRPEKLNALSQTLYSELRHALIRADLAPRIEVVVLTGAGRAFCSGGDLTEVNELHGEDRAIEVASWPANSHATFSQMEHMRKPIVAMVNGLAHAGGLVLVMQSDVAIASDQATFRLPEALRGMANPYAAAHLPASIGVARAKYMLLTGAEINAHTAESWGLIAKAVPTNDLRAEIDGLVASILETKPLARDWNKRIINGNLAPFEGQSLQQTMLSEDTREGTRPFGH